MNTKIKSALVLSGGGCLGLAHVGALKKLEQKFEFEYYAGVSAGAIVVACHAIGKSADEISELIFKQNFFALSFDFSPSNFGILRGIQSALERTFRIFFKTQNTFNSADKRLEIYTPDLIEFKRN